MRRLDDTPKEMITRVIHSLHNKSRLLQSKVQRYKTNAKQRDEAKPPPVIKKIRTKTIPHHHHIKQLKKEITQSGAQFQRVLATAHSTARKPFNPKVECSPQRLFRSRQLVVVRSTKKTRTGGTRNTKIKTNQLKLLNRLQKIELLSSCVSAIQQPLSLSQRNFLIIIRNITEDDSIFINKESVKIVLFRSFSVEVLLYEKDIQSALTCIMKKCGQELSDLRKFLLMFGGDRNHK